MKVAKQTTLRDHTALCGVGIHSGLPVTLTLHPADADTGLRFIRTHVDGWQDREIPADMSAVTATEFASEIPPTISTRTSVTASTMFSTIAVPATSSGVVVSLRA